MKTIYNLEVGDVYYIKRIGKVRTKQVSEVSFEEYQECVNCGIAFLTKEECRASIDYDLALAKIKKRASELGENLKLDLFRHEVSGAIMTSKRVFIWAESIEDKGFELMFGDTGSNLITFGEPLIFEKEENAKIIIEELPEECKTVLEYK